MRYLSVSLWHLFPTPNAQHVHFCSNKLSRLLYILMYKILNWTSKTCLRTYVNPSLNMYTYDEYASLKTCFLIRAWWKSPTSKRKRQNKVFKNHCSTLRVSSLAMSFHIILVRGHAKYCLYCYDHMYLAYSCECLLIITDTKIKRHEKVRMIYPLVWGATHQRKPFFIGDHILHRMWQEDCLRILNEWGSQNQKWPTLMFFMGGVRHKS